MKSRISIYRQQLAEEAEYRSNWPDNLDNQKRRYLWIWNYEEFYLGISIELILNEIFSNEIHNIIIEYMDEDEFDESLQS